MGRPKGWTRHWVNDDCGCDATVVYDWKQLSDELWTPIVVRFWFQRGLFCGTDHESEIRSWRTAVEGDSQEISQELLFEMKGNSEHPKG